MLTDNDPTSFLHPDWITSYRSSVSWGDLIQTSLLPDATACCFVETQGELGPRAYFVPGTLDQLEVAITKARLAKQIPGCGRVVVLFLDTHATVAAVEEAAIRLSAADIATDFLESEPRVYLHGLMTLAQQRTLHDWFYGAEEGQ